MAAAVKPTADTLRLVRRFKAAVLPASESVRRLARVLRTVGVESHVKVAGADLGALEDDLNQVRSQLEGVRASMKVGPAAAPMSNEPC